jgi:hypothetical protein
MTTRGSLKSVPVKKRQRPPDLRDALEEALDELRKLAFVTAADEATVALARKYADEIERTVERAEELEDLWNSRGADRSFYARLEKLEANCDVVRVVGWLGPQLQGVLKELAGTTMSRRAMEKTNPMGGRLDKLKSSLPGNRPTDAGQGEGNTPDLHPSAD